MGENLASLVRPERDEAVAVEVDRTVNEKAEKLREIFIEMEQLDKQNQEKELHAICDAERGQEENYLRPDMALLPFIGGKHPIFAADEVVRLGYDVGYNVGRDIVRADEVHHHPHDKGYYHRVHRADDDEPQYPDRLLHLLLLAHVNAKLVQLLRVKPAGSVEHDIPAGVVLRECYAVTDGVKTREE